MTDVELMGLLAEHDPVAPVLIEATDACYQEPLAVVEILHQGQRTLLIRCQVSEDEARAVKALNEMVEVQREKDSGG